MSFPGWRRRACCSPPRCRRSPFSSPTPTNPASTPSFPSQAPISLPTRPPGFGYHVRHLFHLLPLHHKPCQNRIRVHKALAGSTWGQQRETLFIVLIRSLFTYAVSIRLPITPPSGVLKLQRIQKSALQIATGSLKIASQSHLHSETQILPVQDHLSLLCSQFLLNSSSDPPIPPTRSSLPPPAHD